MPIVKPIHKINKWLFLLSCLVAVEQGFGLFPEGSNRSNLLA
jgi:hypothetical protein